MAVSAASRPALVAALLASTCAWSADRFDHKGAVGLLLSAGGAGKDIIRFSNGPPDEGGRYILEAGGTYAFGYSGNDLVLLGSLGLSPFGATADTSVAGGYRAYFGQERFKTFLDLFAAAHFTPAVTMGLRIGVGAQYELTSVFGAFLALSGEAGAGQLLRFSAQATVGIQLRSYLLE